MNTNINMQQIVRFLFILVILPFVTGTGCSSDHSDKTSTNFGKHLSDKHLPDGKYVDMTATMKHNKAIIEYGTFGNQWTPGGPNYTVTITKYTSPKDCERQTSTYKDSKDAIIDGVFAIIPSNDQVDKAALEKIKIAWGEFKKGGK